MVGLFEEWEIDFFNVGYHLEYCPAHLESTLEKNENLKHLLKQYFDPDEREISRIHRPDMSLQDTSRNQ